MSRLGRSSSGRYTYSPDFSAVTRHYANDELMAAKAQLTQVLGKEQYYQWACTLLDSVLFDDKAYLQAINAKLAQVVEVVHPVPCVQDTTGQEAR